MLTASLIAGTPGQGVADIPAGQAALLGALIGGLAGVLGQYFTERLRQKGELRHQNWLLLQEAYIRAVELMHEARMMAASIVPVTRRLLEQVPEVGRLDGDEVFKFLGGVAPRLGDMLTEIGHTAATIQAGAYRVNYGMDQMQGWHGVAARVVTEGPVNAEQLAQSEVAAECRLPG